MQFWSGCDDVVRRIRVNTVETIPMRLISVERCQIITTGIAFRGYVLGVCERVQPDRQRFGGIMKKLFAGSVALVVTALIATSLSPIKAVAASSVDESSVDALKREISRLRQENAALRKRAAQQDSARSNTATTPQGGALAMATGMLVKGLVAQPVAR